MPSVCLYFHVHQPYRINNFSIFNIGQDLPYFDEKKNKFYLERIARKCYLPTNNLLLNLIKKYKGKFKFGFSITGLILEQLEENFPDVLESFQKLVKTGQAELMAETYHHSLSFLYSKQEFKKQVALHKKKIKKIFNYTPTAFRNTELAFNNEMAKTIEQMGYKTALTEGAGQILGWRSPDFVYKAHGTKNLKVLMRNYQLSDDISFRFSCRDWKEWPLTADKFSAWVNQINGNGQVVNLFMDYETFGEHQWEDTGIFNFLENLPNEILKHKDNNFKTPSQASKAYNPVGEIDCPNTISWADTERDLSAWTGNQMQKQAVQKIYELEPLVISTKSRPLIEQWRKLQTSDHFYYMCTKWFSDADVHQYFNPYESPYECFISYMNILNDLQHKLKNGYNKKVKVA
ncbi:MAG: glycoside hydrolase family 57 protein [Candidatus Pacebacteria bacterium]|nr:glycoside hydrolase family 57 protein [Candidatus Paceibacterota bacterium]